MTISTPLSRQLADAIEGGLRVSGAAPGDRLSERALAETHNVSRTPIRRALRLLEERGLVAARDRGGFVILSVEETAEAEPVPADEERDYLRLAEDRFAGRLPERVSENALLRRYGMARGALARILRRAAEEGWITRLPGHGWRFEPVLTSERAYADSYRFRLLLEPNALLEPEYRVDRPALEQARALQQRLADGEIRTVTPSELFDRNRRFHEAVVAGCGNSFIIESLKRLNRLRRLIEYSRTLEREAALVQVLAHLRIADVLLGGDVEAAAELLRVHLAGVTRLKTRDEVAARL